MHVFKYKGPRTSQFPYGFYALTRQQDALEIGYKEYPFSCDNIVQLHMQEAFKQFGQKIAVQKMNQYLNENLWKPRIERLKKEQKAEKERRQRIYQRQVQLMNIKLKKDGILDQNGNLVGG